MHFSEYDTRLAAYAVIVDAEHRILLSWWNGGDQPERASWSLPGGGVEFDEAVEDAVVREVYEETGYHCELTGFLTTSSYTVAASWSTGRPLKGVRLIYTARIVGGTLGTVEVGGSTDRAAWLPLEEAEGAAGELVGAGIDAWGETTCG